jgi:hypothetical protein
MVFDTWHHTEPVEPGEWFGNVFEKNVFRHETPGEGEMVLYNFRKTNGGGTKSWSIPELEAAYPENWRGNREGESGE